MTVSTRQHSSAAGNASQIPSIPSSLESRKANAVMAETPRRIAMANAGLASGGA
ncbi:MAG: hypothetical protein ACLU3N_10210 [Lachnospiraceae bacterium]